MKIKISLLPNLITAFGLSCGLFIIFKFTFLDVDQNIQDVLKSSAILILIACLADLLDGAVARMTRTESDFGMIFDSVSDAITFGVSPPILVLYSINPMQKSNLALFLTTAAIIFSLCGVIRLVRYSVTKKQDVPDNLVAFSGKNFVGLPIDAAAMGIVSLNFFLFSADYNLLFPPISDLCRSIILVVALLVLGYFMISRWRFPSLSALRFKIRSFNVVFLVSIVAVVVFYGVQNYFPIAFVTIAWLYIIVAWILSLIRLIAGNKSKTLEDFEPEPDDIEIQ